MKDGVDIRCILFLGGGVRGDAEWYRNVPQLVPNHELLPRLLRQMGKRCEQVVVSYGGATAFVRHSVTKEMPDERRQSVLSCVEGDGSHRFEFEAIGSDGDKIGLGRVQTFLWVVYEARATGQLVEEGVQSL